MRMRQDGSFQSSNTPTWANVGLKEDHSLYRCMITKVLYADDDQNVTKNAQNPEVTYEAVILGGFKSGQILTNIRLGSSMSGDTNYWERTLRPTSKNLVDDPLDSHDGDIVLLQFIQSHTGYPIILAMANSINSTYGTKKADGPRSLTQYNGVLEEINNKGEITVTQKLGTLDADNVFHPLETFNIKDQYQLNEKFTRTFKSGLVITEDGVKDQVNIKLKNGTIITIAGSNDQIILKTNGGGELNLVAGKVALGAGGVELLQKISDQLDKIATFMTGTDATHDHIGNMGYPTSPPETASQFTQLGTDLNTIKSAIDSIKGTL